jgi:hypothetical protein
MFLGGVSNTFLKLDGAQWDPAGLSSFQGIANAFLTALTTGTTVAGLAVCSKVDATCRLVTSILVRPYVGSQRRRSEQAEPH